MGRKCGSYSGNWKNDEIDDDIYLKVIEIADNEYHNLNGKLGELLETYFIKIYTELIEVIDD